MKTRTATSIVRNSIAPRLAFSAGVRVNRDTGQTTDGKVGHTLTEIVSNSNDVARNRAESATRSVHTNDDLKVRASSDLTAPVTIDEITVSNHKSIDAVMAISNSVTVALSNATAVMSNATVDPPSSATAGRSSAVKTFNGIMGGRKAATDATKSNILSIANRGARTIGKATTVARETTIATTQTADVPIADLDDPMANLYETASMDNNHEELMLDVSLLPKE